MRGEISASELAEFDFCSVAWYLDKEGYRRSRISSVHMTAGRDMHRRVSTYHKRAETTTRAGLVGAIVIAVLLVILLSGIL